MDERPNDSTRVWLVRTIDPKGCQDLKGVFGSFERAEAYVVEYHMTGHLGTLSGLRAAGIAAVPNAPTPSTRS
jgi:hypothetical protein